MLQRRGPLPSKPRMRFLPLSSSIHTNIVPGPCKTILHALLPNCAQGSSPNYWSFYRKKKQGSSPCWCKKGAFAKHLHPRADGLGRVAPGRGAQTKHWQGCGLLGERCRCRCWQGSSSLCPEKQISVKHLSLQRKGRGGNIRKCTNHPSLLCMHKVYDS